jgi:hypothetical protein
LISKDEVPRYKKKVEGTESELLEQFRETTQNVMLNYQRPKARTYPEFICFCSS